MFRNRKREDDLRLIVTGNRFHFAVPGEKWNEEDSILHVLVWTGENWVSAYVPKHRVYYSDWKFIDEEDE